MKAKTLSLIAKGVGLVVILLGSFAVGKGWLNLSVNDVIKIGASCVVCVGTIDINILVDKIVSIKKEDEVKR